MQNSMAIIGYDETYKECLCSSQTFLLSLSIEFYKYNKLHIVIAELSLLKSS